MGIELKEIFEGTEYCTLATVCEDASPWSVPIRFAYDDHSLYFRSPAGTTHGSNITRDSRVSIVIVDTSQSTKGAVYLHSNAEKLDDKDEQYATNVFNQRFNNPPDQWSETEYYRVAIGTLDEARTKARMYYFQTESAQ